MIKLVCFRTALEVEELVRSRDVIPATIGILEGKIHVGKYGFWEGGREIEEGDGGKGGGGGGGEGEGGREEGREKREREEVEDDVVCVLGGRKRD